MKKWIDILNKGELNFPHIKIIYPSAPAQPYTPNNGMVLLISVKLKKYRLTVIYVK